MCIAIVKPIGAAISDAYLAESFRSNNDGAGFAFAVDGKVIVGKGYMKFDDFLPAYREAELKYGEKSDALIHFRIATHGGPVTPDNCHPYEFDHGALIHNGYFFSGVDNKSDTRYLTEQIGKWLTFDAATAAKERLDKYFGSNKVALLFNDGKRLIFNEDGGHWAQGVWYSNHSYETVGRAASAYSSHTPVTVPVVCGLPDRAQYDDTAWPDDLMDAGELAAWRGNMGYGRGLN
jgi:predicted glutamine amidotransferase